MRTTRKTSAEKENFRDLAMWPFIRRAVNFRNTAEWSVGRRRRRARYRQN